MMKQTNLQFVILQFHWIHVYFISLETKLPPICRFETEEFGFFQTPFYPWFGSGDEHADLFDRFVIIVRMFDDFIDSKICCSRFSCIGRHIRSIRHHCLTVSPSHLLLSTVLRHVDHRMKTRLTFYFGCDLLSE